MHAYGVVLFLSLTTIISTENRLPCKTVLCGIHFALVAANEFHSRKMMKNVILKILLLLFVMNLTGTEFVSGQTRDDFTRVLQKLDDAIHRVRQLTTSFNHTRALELVERAQRLRNEAVTAAKNGHLAEAKAKFDLAFALLEQAAKLTLSGPIHRLRNQLEELLRQADDVVPRSRNKEAQRILNEAKKNRAAGEEAVASLRIQKATEHYRVGITLAERSITLVQHSPGLTLDRILQEKRKFENLMERAREVVEHGSNDRAPQIFHQAINLAHSAEEAFRNGNIELAKRFYNQSVLLLLRAMDLASGESGATVNQAEAGLFRLRDHIGDVRDAITQSASPRASRLFERATRFANEAQSALHEDKSYEALWKIELAENMLKRAARLARNGNQPQLSRKISREIQNTAHEIAAVQSRVTPDSPKDAAVLLKMARLAVKRAEQAETSGMRRVALEATLAAQRFLTRAERVLDAKESGDYSGEQLRVRFNQLDAAIAESEERIVNSGQSWNLQLLQSAKDIRQMSYESYQNGNYTAANEGIQVSFELLRKSLKNVPKN